MKVRVTKSEKGSPDGIEIRDYLAGETYEMPEWLGGVFVREGWGVEVKIEMKPEPGPDADKSLNPVIEKKAAPKKSKKKTRTEIPNE